MQGNMHDGGAGMMGGSGLWTVLSVLLAVFLILGIIRMLKSK